MNQFHKGFKHRAYLAEKRLFICTEDPFYKTESLKNIVNSKGYLDSFKNNKTALAFGKFISRRTEIKLSADTLMSYFITKENYKLYLNQVTLALDSVPNNKNAGLAMISPSAYEYSISAPSSQILSCSNPIQKIGSAIVFLWKASFHFPSKIFE